MDAVSESKVLFSAAMDVESVGGGKNLLVAIGGPEQQKHHVAWLQVLPVHGGRARERPGKSLDWRVVAQELLDGAWKELWIVRHCVPGVGFASKRYQTVAEEVGGRLVPGDQQ